MSRHDWCLCGNDIDVDDLNTVLIGPEPVLYSHLQCDDELKRRFNSNLCLTCSETPNGLDYESCEKCGVQYCDPDRKFLNF